MSVLDNVDVLYLENVKNKTTTMFFLQKKPFSSFFFYDFCI